MAGVQTPAIHRQRAEQHERVGEALFAAASEDWAAVCLFYAAYHHVRAALLEDPVFDHLDWCMRRNPDLRPEDRNVTRHKGRRQTGNGREFGLNDLVSILYPKASGAYELLHQASIDVRYERGLREGGLEGVRNAFQRFKQLVEEGALVTVPSVLDVPPGPMAG